MKISFFCNIWIFIFLLISSVSCFASMHNNYPQGFNWYNEQIEQEKKQKEEVQTKPSPNKDSEELPEYEKNIRSLQKKHEAAHRRALDNPTQENLLAELYFEKEMMRKSRIYGEKRVVVAMLDSKFTNMQRHSNVLHRSVQEQVDSAKTRKNLKSLSKDWGLILQVSEDCPHCHVFAPIILEFAKEYDLQLLAATKDGSDFKGIEGVLDSGQMVVFNPTRETPILFLVKGDGKEVWPISRGINSSDQIIQRIKNIDKHIRRLF